MNAPPENASVRARARAGLIRIETWAGGLNAMALLLLGAYELVTRYLVPKLAIAWLPEVMIYMMVWGVFLAGGLLVEKNQHVRADLFTARAGPRLARALDLIAMLAGLTLSGLLLWHAIGVVRSNRAMEAVSVSELAFPMWIYSASIVVGATMMGLHFLDRVISCVFDPIPTAKEATP